MVISHVISESSIFRRFVMIPQYRPIYTPVHVHLVSGSILFPSSGGNSLVAKLSSGEPGVVGSSPGVSTSPSTFQLNTCHGVLSLIPPVTSPVRSPPTCRGTRFQCLPHGVAALKFAGDRRRLSRRHGPSAGSFTLLKKGSRFSGFTTSFSISLNFPPHSLAWAVHSIVPVLSAIEPRWNLILRYCQCY